MVHKSTHQQYVLQVQSVQSGHLQSLQNMPTSHSLTSYRCELKPSEVPHHAFITFILCPVYSWLAGCAVIFPKENGITIWWFWNLFSYRFFLLLLLLQHLAIFEAVPMSENLWNFGNVLYFRIHKVLSFDAPCNPNSNVSFTEIMSLAVGRQVYILSANDIKVFLLF